MSILLDALKKSESQRQLGTTPGIHTSVEPPTANGTSGQQWLPLSMLALSAVAIAWFGWQQYREPPVQPESTRQQLSSPLTEETRALAKTDAGPGQIRTPVESFQAESKSPDGVTKPLASNAQESDARKQSLNRSFSAYEAQEEPDPGGKLQESRLVTVQTPTEPGSADPSPAGNSQATVTTKAPQKRRSRMKPNQSEPISFWQVPQALRDGLPELRITVLVYAEAPEDRFVLINGQRIVEKEELISGVVLDEIRRDGAVFLYRNYRFLVKG